MNDVTAKCCDSHSTYDIFGLFYMSPICVWMQCDISEGKIIRAEKQIQNFPLNRLPRRDVLSC